MWTITEIKEYGRDAFKHNYGPSVLAALILFILTAGGAAFGSGRASTATTATPGAQPGVDATVQSMSSEEQAAALAAVIVVGAIIAAIGFVAKTFLYNPVEVGYDRFFKKNCDDSDTKLGTVVEGFQDYQHVVVTMLLRDVFTFLWSLLLVIPGIVKAYSYLLVPYIIKDMPELSPKETIALSSKMMQGNRGQAFLMDLSFAGWYLLGAVTANLGNIFWTNPYHASARAALYEHLRTEM